MGNETYGANNHGGSGYQRRNYPIATGDPMKDENAKKKYSDSLRDPNDVNYNNNQGMPRDSKDPFFDSMRDSDTRGRGNYRGRNPRGGERGNGGYERGSGYHRGGGRGGRPNNYADPKKDAETFGETTAENFKFNHEAQAQGRGGRGSRGGKGADRTANHRDRRGGQTDHYQNALN